MKKLFKNICFLLLIFNCSIQNKEEGINNFKNHFQDYAKSNKNIQNASILIHSDKYGIHYEDSIDKEGFNQKYHIASIGKVFTNVLIHKAIISKKISLDDNILKYLSKDLIGNLYIYENENYSNQVTIKMLLDHTSGVADYFEGDSTQSGLKEILSNPDYFWNPSEILNFTKKHFSSKSKPGSQFYYSDTGYILLGLILEKTYKDSFESILAKNILNPLKMNDTNVHLRSLPINKSDKEISKMFLGDVDVTKFKSVSMDWAGGGIVSTNQDLFKFQKALWNGDLIPLDVVNSWKGNNKFHEGIYYGTGLMTVRFGDMLFIMKGTPDLYGHSGLLSTLMFYSPDYDLHIISNFGSTDSVSKSFEMMFFLMRDMKDIVSLQAN
jgi:D-alanyl-D-alanine carboxypeptidase